MSDSSPTPRAPFKAWLHFAAWPLFLFAAWKGLVNYWFYAQMSGFFTPPIAFALLLYLGWRIGVQLRARSFQGSWRGYLACVLILFFAKIDLIQYFFRPAFFDAPDTKHPAVEAVVSREKLAELGIGQYIKGALYAPGESDRDLYLYAGIPWRKVLSGVTSLAAYPAAETIKAPRWRTGMSAPLYDVRFLPGMGRLLATQKRPPALLLIDPAKLVVEKSIAWTLGGLPALVYDISEDGRSATVFAEGEGETGTLDAAAWRLSPGPSLAEQARAAGVPLTPHTFAPFQASPALDGLRYLSVWQDTPVLLELAPGPRLVRTLDLRPAPRFADLHTFRFTGLVVDPSQKRAYVADSFHWNTGRIVEVDLETMKAVRISPAPLGVQRLVLDPERSRLYAASPFGGALVVYDIVADGALAEHARLYLGRALRVLQWDETRPRTLLAASAHGVFRIRVDRL